MTSSRIPQSEWMSWIKEKLQDGEWHTREDLIDQAMAVTGASHEQARAAIARLARYRGYEAEYRLTAKRHFVSRLRKHPTLRPYQNLRTCKSCGRANLTREERVRREHRYWFVKESGVEQKLSGVASIFLCIPCAKEEVELSGKPWEGPE